MPAYAGMTSGNILDVGSLLLIVARVQTLGIIFSSSTFLMGEESKVTQPQKAQGLHPGYDIELFEPLL